jgi:hypothetical protein
MTHLKTLLLAILTLLCPALKAQKLPNIQKEGFIAPDDVRIDGKAAEWGNGYKAFNHSTDIFYTLANDNKRLFLVIHASDILSIKKIIGGGVKFTVSATRSADSTAIGIKYPVIAMGTTSTLGLLLNEYPTSTDPVIKTHQADSILKLTNKMLTNSSKEILLSGISELGDTVSVYNSTGLKAAVTIDASKQLTYELSIPLKYLKVPLNKPFCYQIELSGMIAAQKPVYHNTAQGQVMVVTTPRSIGAGFNGDRQLLMYPTNFWGEYKLAK